MAICSEVNAICSLLQNAAEFSTQIRDGWYKGSAEMDDFPIKVVMLSAKHAQWTSQLRRFGMTDDEHLKPLVMAAAEILDKEQNYVSRIRKSRFVRFKRRAFPGQLTCILNSLMEIVDSSRQLLETRLETNHLLERILAQTPSPLTFGLDRKYVPLLGSITEVQKALDDADGPRVVTVYGGPGMGKTSLVKYLALHYQNTRKQHMATTSSTSLCFPDGVFYLLCGKGAKGRVKQLQIDLLESLGGGVGSESAESNGGTYAREQEGEYVHLPSSQKKLRFLLAEQKLLIILDDIWEAEVVENFLVPGNGVKYLVTSQIRSIWDDAKKIELKNPNMAEARMVLANYTEGLPTKGEFPESIQIILLADEIIKELEYHPLSLANVGLTINRSRATDPEEWEIVKDNLRDQLDENDLQASPIAYEKRYPVTVGASMMLMVDSLLPEARGLLFLTALMEGHELPGDLVKFFLKHILPTEPGYKYRRYITYLEDRSLIELRYRRAYGIITTDEVHRSRFVLASHGLRTHYIRKYHTVDLEAIATKILSGGAGSSNHGGPLIQSLSIEETLGTIMGAMYFEKPFKYVAATKLQSQSRLINGGSIPRSMSNDEDVPDLMERTQKSKFGLQPLIRLLSPGGEGGWQQQAHDYARKILIRFTFRQELDDDNMERLIALPHTTTAACEALSFMVQFYWNPAFVDHQRRTFLTPHGETLKTLLCILHDNAATTCRRAAVVAVLGTVLYYENDDTIRTVAKKWVEFLAKDSSPTLQTAVTRAVRSGLGSSRVTILVGEFSGLLERLLMLIVEGKDSYVRGEAAQAIYALCESSTIVSRIMAIPGALEILFKKFLSKDQQHPSEYDFIAKCYAGQSLHRLSCIVENRVRLITFHDCLNRLSVMLTSTPKPWSSSSKFLVTAAEIVGTLALTTEVRKNILATNPEVEEGLRSLQRSYFSGDYGPLQDTEEIAIILRGLTILDPLQANNNPTIITPNPSPSGSPGVCYEAYMGRARAYQEMQMYSEALSALNIAHQYFQQSIGSKYNTRMSWWEFRNFRIRQMFLKAMLGDYEGAMCDANSAIEENYKEGKLTHGIANFRNGDSTYYVAIHLSLLGERGVLKLLLSRRDPNLVGALADLDKALNCKLMMLPGVWLKLFGYSYGWLKHRGLVKHKMGDNIGARADAQSALQCKLRGATLDMDDVLGPKCLIELPTNYLGFTL